MLPSSASFGNAQGVSDRWAFVGATGQSAGGEDGAGVVHVYENTQSGWQHRKTLQSPSPQFVGRFGWSIKMSPTGDMVAIAEINGEMPDESAGELVHLFYRDEGGVGNWGLKKTLYSRDYQTQLDLSFGRSITFSDTGGLLMVGAPRLGNGAVYVYDKDRGGSDNWAFETRLTLGGSGLTQARDNFGHALAYENARLVIGAPFADVSADNAGLVEVWSRHVNGWQRDTRLTSSVEGENFGYALAFDNDRVLVSATGAAETTGTAYLYRRDASQLTLLKQLSPPFLIERYFGSAVALRGDFAVVAANGPTDGSVFVYEKDVGGVGEWDEILRLVSSHRAVGSFNPNTESFASDVDINATQIWVSASHASDGNNTVGAVYVFDYSDDVDGDGVVNKADNCFTAANPNQVDSDRDGLGNICECPMDAMNPDGDEDAICDAADNCPADDNADQADADGDGVGDVCDACPLDAGADNDGDGVCFSRDNCPLVANADQADADNNGIGDACELCADGADLDGDGICDASDNCPDVANAEQADADNDGNGDACSSSGGGGGCTGSAPASLWLLLSLAIWRARRTTCTPM